MLDFDSQLQIISKFRQVLLYPTHHLFNSNLGYNMLSWANSFAWDFYYKLCLFVSPLYLYLSFPSSPSLFLDKKFPALGPIPSLWSKFGDYIFPQWNVEWI